MIQLHVHFNIYYYIEKIGVEKKIHSEIANTFHK